MQIFLIRHGSAESMAERDRDRRLTAKGREEISAMAAAHKKELSSVTQVWVSPYVRAQQSFDLMQEQVPELAKAVIETQNDITPDGHPDIIIEKLYSSTAPSILLVTHQPLVGILLDQLCALEAGQYRMCTGSLACVNMPSVVAKGLGELLWLKHS